MMRFGTRSSRPSPEPSVKLFDVKVLVREGVVRIQELFQTWRRRWRRAGGGERIRGPSRG